MIHRTVISLNEKEKPTGNELIRIAYGNNLSDLAGSIHKRTSFWAIDESGSTGWTKKTLGMAITYCATTQLSPASIQAIFDGIPLESKTDKNGEVTEKIHYNYLRQYYPEELKLAMERISQAPFLFLSLLIEKTSVTVTIPHKKVFRPRNAIYVMGAIDRLVRAIEIVDSSEHIVVSFDSTNDLSKDLLEYLWTDRTTVLMEKSSSASLLQVADLASSSVGNAINYPHEMDEELFWLIFDQNTNLSAPESPKRSPMQGMLTKAKTDFCTGKRKSTNKNKKPSVRKTARFVSSFGNKKILKKKRFSKPVKKGRNPSKRGRKRWPVRTANTGKRGTRDSSAATRSEIPQS